MTRFILIFIHDHLNFGTPAGPPRHRDVGRHSTIALPLLQWRSKIRPIFERSLQKLSKAWYPTIAIPFGARFRLPPQRLRFKSGRLLRKKSTYLGVDLWSVIVLPFVKRVDFGCSLM